MNDLSTRTQRTQRNRRGAGAGGPGPFFLCVLCVLCGEFSPRSRADDGLFVAVGYGGRRMASRDGKSWEHIQQWADKGGDDSNNLMGLCFGKGKWVCVGGGGFGKDNQAGHILTSADGKSWREVAKYPFRVNPVLFHAERFVAGGPSRQLLWSDDGEAWREGAKVELPNDIPAWAFWFRKGACGNGTFVFMGNAGKDQKIWWCLTSKDGQKSESFSTELPRIEGLAFGAGKFVAASKDQVLTSADGVKWQAVADLPADEWRGVIWTGTQFFLSGKQKSLVSADGMRWSEHGKAPPCSVLYSDGRTWIGTGWPGQMFHSSDGKTWAKVGQPQPAMGVNQVLFGKP